MSLFNDSNTTDEEWEVDNLLEAKVPVLCTLENGTPEDLQMDFLERNDVGNETLIKGQGSIAFSPVKRMGFCSEFEQAGQLTENQALYPRPNRKRTKAVKEDISEERETLSGELEQADQLSEKQTYYPLSKRKRSKTVKKETLEKRMVGWSDELEQPETDYPGLKRKCTKREKETPEEQEQRLLRNREKSKMLYRAKMESETPEEREKRLEKVRIWRIKREARRSEADKERILKRKRQRYVFNRANETPEQREKRLAWVRSYQRQRKRPRKPLTGTKRAILLEKRKIRYALRKASETPKERALRLAKVRAYERSKPRNRKGREMNRERKLKKTFVKPKWEVKIEAVESAVLPVPPENHSLLSEVKVEPDDLEEMLLTYVKKEVIPTVSPVQGSSTDSSCSQHLASKSDCVADFQLEHE